MWQKCPICNGTGVIREVDISNVTDRYCNVCKGKKIISQLTGLPPNTPIDIKTDPFYAPPYKPSGDFRDDNMEGQQEYFGK